MRVGRGEPPLVLLSALRSVGAGAFLAARLGAKTFDLEQTAESRYLVRLFAARNAAMTAGLIASDRRARRLWWQAGLACDGLDAVAGLLGLREGKQRSSALVDTGASLLAAALGVAGLRSDARRSNGGVLRLLAPATRTAWIGR